MDKVCIKGKGPYVFFNKIKQEFSSTMFFVNSDRMAFYKCLILSFLIFCSFLYGYFAYVALFVGIVFVITETKIKAFYYLVFLLPFYNVFRFTNEQWYFSIWLMVAFIIVVLVRFLHDLAIKKIKINWILTLSYFFVGSYLLLTIGTFNISNLLPIGTLLAVSYIFFYYCKEIDFKNLTLFLFYGIIISSVFSIFIGIFPRLDLFVQRFTSYSEHNYRFQGLSRDPNYYALEVLLCLSCLSCLFFNRKINWLYYPAIIYLTCLGIATGSKSFLLVYILFILVSLIVILVKHNFFESLWRVLLCFIICAVIPFGICYKQTQFLYLRVTNKSYSNMVGIEIDTENDIESEYGSNDNNQNSQIEDNQNEREITLNSFTTGRSSIWKQYIKRCFGSVKNFLFGVGIGSSYLSYNGSPIAIHNTAIQCLYFLGLIGVLLFVSLAIIYLIELKKIKQIKLVNLFVPLFIIALMMCGLDNLFSYRLYIVVVILYYSLFESDQNELKGNNSYEWKVTIVIPVYKVENYLDRCVESVVKQAYKNLEIILVDDGSPDNCPQICDEWAKKDERIKVIHKENGGLSDARNIGIQNATGEFLLFVDSDDYVDENLSSILENLGTGDVKIINSYFLHVGDRCKISSISNLSGNVSINEFISKIDVNSKINSACMKICKVDFIKSNQLYFEKGIIYEDMVWTMKLLNMVKTLEVIDGHYYHYISDRNDSIMNKTNLKSFENMFSNANNVMLYYKTKYTDTRFFNQCCLTHNILSLCRRVRFLQKNERNKVFSLIKSYKYFIMYDFKTFILLSCLKVLGPKITCTILGFLI